MKSKLHIISPSDNIGTVISSEVTSGTILPFQINGKDDQVEVANNIPYGHKIAIKDIDKGEDVLKYGLSIGSAFENIKKGDHVHVHNIESNRGRGDLYNKSKEEIGGGIENGQI